MSITKAPLSVVTRLFVLSLEDIVVNWYYRLEKSIQADWSELSAAFLKKYEPNTKLRNLELAKQRRNKSLSDSLTRFINNADLTKNELNEEEDEVGIIILDILPNLVKRLQRMNPKTFVDLYDGL